MLNLRNTNTLDCVDQIILRRRISLITSIYVKFFNFICHLSPFVNIYLIYNVLVW